MMNLRRLRYFVTVADERHFGRAAAKLLMAQPPLSQQIKVLEQELGLTLFNRSRRQVSLTREGEVLYPEAKRLVVEADLLEVRMRNLSIGAEGTLRLGFVDSAAYAVMPRLVRAYRRRWPSVGQELFNLSSDQQIDALAVGEIDVGIIRVIRPGADVRTRPVLDERLVAAVGADHRLFGQERTSLAELAGDTFIGFSRTLSPSLFNELSAIFARSGLLYQPAVEVSSYSTVLGLVASGQGVGVVPETTRSLQLDELSFLDLDDAAARSTMMLVARPGDTSALVHRAFELIGAATVP